MTFLVWVIVLSKSKIIALCGVFAALATVILCFGSFLPFMTYVCPVICICMASFVMGLCGRSMAWTWYFSVSVLGLLLCADKEAASIFVTLGYYPMLKVKLDTYKVSWLFKFIFFNLIIFALYWLLIKIMGFQQIMEDFSQIGIFMKVFALLLGNVVFYFVDRVLNRVNRMMK